MGKILPILIALVGLGAGVGAGIALRPAPEPVDVSEGSDGDAEHAETEDSDHDGSGVDADGDDADVDETEEDIATHDYVKLNNQFVIPVVRDGRVSALVVLSLSLEVPLGQTEVVYEREPKLRDAFLQTMFDHANFGGFEGNFTSSGQLNALREALKEVAKKYTGSVVTDVLILDIVRQDT